MFAKIHLRTRHLRMVDYILVQSGRELHPLHSVVHRNFYPGNTHKNSDITCLKLTTPVWGWWELASEQSTPQETFARKLASRLTACIW